MESFRLNDGQIVYLIRNDIHFSKWTKENGVLDCDYGHQNIIRKYINSGDICLDVGANIGTHSLAYIKWDAIVYAFEPLKIAYECLIKNVISDNFYSDNIALGNDTKKVKLNSFDMMPGCTYLSETNNDEEAIELKKLDDLYIENIKFIKVDVEGWELEFLKGAENTIKKYKPVLDLEFADHTLARNNLTCQDLFNKLAEYKYYVVNCVNDYPQRDLIFVHEDNLSIDLVIFGDNHDIDKILNSYKDFRHLIIFGDQLINYENPKIFYHKKNKSEQIIKMTIDNYTDADYIMFIHPYYLNTESKSVFDYFQNNKPIIKIDFFHNLPKTPWDDFLKKLNLFSNLEFMRTYPFIYPKFLIPFARQYLENITKSNIENAIKKFNPFSEFNLFGAYFYKYKNDYFVFI